MHLVAPAQGVCRTPSCWINSACCAAYGADAVWELEAVPGKSCASPGPASQTVELLQAAANYWIMT